MTEQPDLPEQIRLLHHADMTVEGRRDAMLSLLAQHADDEDTHGLFTQVQELIFPGPEWRGSAVVSMLGSTGESKSRVLSRLGGLENIASGLLLAETFMKAISFEAAEEIRTWTIYAAAMRADLPEQDSFLCAHCGKQCQGTYAVMDGWILCLAKGDGMLSCFTRAHDNGEALGSAMMKSDDENNGDEDRRGERR